MAPLAAGAAVSTLKPCNQTPTERLRRAYAEKAVDGNLLFEMLSAPARQAIFRSMAPLAVGAGEVLIKQGDADATLFYVLERGSCDVLVAAGAEPPKRVHTYAPGR